MIVATFDSLLFGLLEISEEMRAFLPGCILLC